MSRKQSTLQRELRQRRPFASLGIEAAVAIRRTADVILQVNARTIEPFGITEQQYNVLRILRGMHPDSLPTLEIGVRMIERQPNVTRLLDRLEGKGLVVRQRSAEDRRVVQCRIADAGLALLAQIQQPLESAIDRQLRKLTEEEKAQLLVLLERVRAGQTG